MGSSGLLDLLDMADAGVNPRVALEREHGARGGVASVVGPIVEADVERGKRARGRIGVEEVVPLRLGALGRRSLISTSMADGRWWVDCCGWGLAAASSWPAERA